LPRALQTFMALEGAWLEQLRAPRQRTRLHRLAGLLLLDALLLALVVIAAAKLFDNAVALLAPRIGMRSAQAAVVVATALAGSPFVFGIIRLVGALAAMLGSQALPQADGSVDRAAAPRRALVVALQLITAIVLGLPLVAFVQLFLPGYAAPLVFAVVLAALALRLWRSAEALQGHVRAGAQVLVEALAAQARPSSAPPPEADELGSLFPGLGSPVPVVIVAASPAIGKTLAELNLRGRTGATVLAIRRGTEGVLVPTGREILRAADVLALAGTHEALAAARIVLAPAAALQVRPFSDAAPQPK
jgi:CPA2 family monovalent cation:H+ antiporter-2